MKCMIGGLECGDASGWAQALAAAVAMGLALQQGWAAAGRERQRDLAAMHSAYGALQGALQTVNSSLGPLLLAANPEAARYVARRALDGVDLRTAAQILASFDLTRLPAPAASAAVMMGQAGLLECLRGLEHLNRGDQDGFKLVEQGTAQLNEAVARVLPMTMIQERPLWWRLLHSMGRV